MMTIRKMNTEWYNFQEEISNYFKSIGFEAETNKRINGIRTNHDIDVLVHTKFMGQKLTWIVEAKKWKSKINKLQVLGLRSIVEDTGADKGFIISEMGFQKGALEATKNTNITLITFSELKNITKEFVEVEQLSTYSKRIYLIEKRYFTHDKRTRIKYGLRADIAVYDIDYSVPFVLETAKIAIRWAINKEYPIDLNTLVKEQHGALSASNFQQLINWLNLNLNAVDRKILETERKMQKDGNFHPKFK